MRRTALRLAAVAAAVLAAAGSGRAAVPFGWGFNLNGELGDGTYENRMVPVRVSNLTSVVSISAGSNFGAAVKDDGTVWTWGYNYNGQLGDGTWDSRNYPAQVPGLSGFVAVSCGSSHVLALKGDGTVWAWGNNGQGQLGDGTFNTSNTPVQVAGLTNVVGIAAGYNHSLAVKADGTAWAWGGGLAGELGNGTNDYSATTPVRVSGLTNVIAVAGGYEHSLFLTSTGPVYACGRNGSGQLGDGTILDKNLPVQVIGLSDVIAVSAGEYHSLAVRSDGTAWAWGDNLYNQLGDGTTTMRTTPVQVSDLTGVTKVAGSYLHSLALKSDGTVWTWGANYSGQLGNPDAGSQSSVPVQTLGLSHATDIAGSRGGSQSFALEQLTTSLYVPDRTGTITETVTLRGYLKRTIDNTWLPGKTIAFAVDGTGVGSAVTDSNGRAQLNWVITDGPASRVIGATFAGDGDYWLSSGSSTLTCQTWSTKMAAFDRTQRITGRTELKCRLLRSDNTPLYNKTIHFYVDGTYVISRTTDTQGYAKYPYYDVPDGTGAGTRPILSVWPGNGGYLPVDKIATLTVLKAMPYIWVAPKSCPAGGTVKLYAYFRRLYDLAKQEGKTLSFSVDGTWIADITTGWSYNNEGGVARYLFNTTGLSVGTHTIRCEFAGDAWVDAGYGEGTLTIY